MGVEIEYDATFRQQSGAEIFGIRYTVDRPYAIFQMAPFDVMQSSVEYAILSRATNEPYAFLYTYPDRLKIVGNFARMPLFANLSYDPDGYFLEGTFWRPFSVGAPQQLVQAGLTYMKNRKVRPHYANISDSQAQHATQQDFVYAENPPFIEMRDSVTGTMLLSLNRTDVNLELRIDEAAEPTIVRYMAISYQMRELHRLLSGQFEENEADRFPTFFDSAYGIIFGKRELVE